MKITKTLIKEILKMENPTNQDIEALRLYLSDGLQRKLEDKLLYKIVYKLNRLNNKGSTDFMQLVFIGYLAVIVLVLGFVCALF